MLLLFSNKLQNNELDNYRDPQGEFKNQLLAVSEIQIETPIAIMRMPRKDTIHEDESMLCDL